MDTVLIVLGFVVILGFIFNSSKKKQEEVDDVEVMQEIEIEEEDVSKS